MSSASKFMWSTSDAKPLFNSAGDNKVHEKDTLIVMTLETDITNTSSKTLEFDGMGGYAGGDYGWVIPGNKQIDTRDIDDSTIGQKVQAHKTVEDKDLHVVLSSGKTLKVALKKIPEGTLKIKTAGVSDDSMKQLGGNRVVEMKLPHIK
ncbi:hypothetical protein [Furfurilactobacillus siliginis]|nr:hypothetical protein [Furfurilactobacillus siliginis]